MVRTDLGLSVSAYCRGQTMTEQDRICGALGCTNKAVGTIPHNGKVVWTCKECADEKGKTVIME